MLYPEQLVDTHVIAIISTNSEPHLKDWRNALGSLTWITAGSDGYAQPVTDLLGSINVESPQNRQLKPHVDVDYVRVRRGKRFLQGWCARTPPRNGSSIKTTSCGALIGSSARLGP